MTVYELREALKKHRGDLKVVVQGYEYGYADVDIVRAIRLVRDANINPHYGGHHEESDRLGTEVHLLLDATKRG